MLVYSVLLNSRTGRVLFDNILVNEPVGEKNFVGLTVPRDTASLFDHSRSRSVERIFPLEF